MMDRPTLVLFTKAPLPGHVKTRFLPHTTAETAAAIALQMIEDTLSMASTCWPGPVRLLVSPNSNHTQLTELAVRYNAVVGTQSRGDLGQKMQSAICDGLETSTAVAIMGCDIPSVTASILGYAFESLSNGANVIGPSADGGFYLIGTQQCVPGMLDKITWSTNTVLQSVLANSTKLGVSFDVLLPCLNDVDSWQDFKFLASIVPKYRKFLDVSEKQQDSV